MKKGQLNKILFLLVVVFFIAMFIIGLIVFIRGDLIIPEQRAEEQCNKLGLELFDYSGEGFFSHESYTCWNPITKEVKLIK